jgi:UDP-N-acetylglucosamine--N-acetylmuramyl-(pentapeptide) pyrophosphoryl-undecaprenol N-acetylglucosamine transferase
VVAALVASAGGHLVELQQIADMTGIRDRLWVTYDVPMARSMLAGEPVVWTPYAPPRDPRVALRDLRSACRSLRDHEVEVAVTTGASIAVGWLAAARLHGIDSHYVESAARIDGPSLSMRLCRRIPGVALYSQSLAWADRRHPYVGSVFDGFASGAPKQLPDRRLRVLVTLGTNQAFGFQRLVSRLVEMVPEVEIRWQVTESDVRHAPLHARTAVTWSDLVSDHAWADVVVAHAGVGSALVALRAGRHPVLVPRRLDHGETVDDHQGEIAEMLAARGIATALEADAVTSGDLHAAAMRSVISSAELRPASRLAMAVAR